MTLTSPRSHLHRQLVPSPQLPADPSSSQPSDPSSPLLLSTSPALSLPQPHVTPPPSLLAPPQSPPPTSSSSHPPTLSLSNPPPTPTSFWEGANISFVCRQRELVPVWEKKRPRKSSPQRNKQASPEEQLDEFLTRGCCLRKQVHQTV